MDFTKALLPNTCEIPTFKATNKVRTLVPLHSKNWALSKRKHVSRSVCLYIACIYIIFLRPSCPTICHVDMSVLLGLLLCLTLIIHELTTSRTRAAFFSISSLVRFHIIILPFKWLKVLSIFMVKRKLHGGLQMWILFSSSVKQYFMSECSI